MLAIYKRELKSYFSSMIGYVFLAVSLFLIGIFFFACNLYMGYPYYSYTIQLCTLVLLVSVPILTMRLIAGERKDNTDKLLLSSPISVTSIVVGKFLAAYTVFLIPCAVSSIYPLILRRFGTVPIGEAYVALFGYILYGAACIAIGVYFSSTVKRPVVAAIISFFALLLGYMMASIIGIFTASEGTLSNILSIYDLSTPLNYMTNGVMDLVSIFYYVSLTVLFIFLTVQSIQKKRHTVTAKNFVKCPFNVIGIFVAIVAFIAANVLVKKIPDRYTNIDCSYNKVFSITKETKDYIATINEDIKIYVLNSKTGYDEYMTKVLEKYDNESEHISVEYIDQYLYPRFYLDYTTTAPEAGSLIVVGSKLSKIVGYSSFYEYDYTNYSYTGVGEISGFAGESQINSALQYVTSGSLIKVYVLTGHGEAELDENYDMVFESAESEQEIVNLDNIDIIPGNVAGVIINGATKDLSDEDVNKLYTYLDNGGKVVITLARTDNDTPNIDGLLDYMDIAYSDGMIVENDPNYYYDNARFLLPEVGSNRYTNGLPEYPLVVDAVELLINEDNEDVSYDSFMVTTEDAFMKVNYTESDLFDESEGDFMSKFTIGVEAKRQVTDENGIVTNPTMLVFASSQIFDTELDVMVNGANIFMFYNIISSFVGETSLAPVDSKILTMPYLTIAETDRNVIVVITMLIIPVCILAYGIYICMKRKRY